MTNLSENRIYRFGQVEVDLSRNCLLLDGEEKHLRQKAFQVLVYLLENRERLVSKDELFEKIWQETAVTDDVLVQCVKEIRRVTGDDSHNPRFIKTVPKAGYRFIGEIENQSTFVEQITQIQFEIEEDFYNEPPRLMAHKKSKIFQTYRNLLAVLLLVICLLTIGFYFYGRSNSPKAEVRLPSIEGKKTVAVMFFENKSNTAELEWLREGLTDMLISDLSRSEKLTVLSRPALRNFLENRGFEKVNFDESFEIAQIVQAEFIITGSFAIIGERLRLDVQLFAVQTKNLLTSESLIVEKPEQILSEIDLLSLKISHQLDAPPIEKPSLGLGMTNNLEAYRYFSLALEKAGGLQTKEALELLEKAVALDNEFAMAYARIGYVYALSIGQGDKGKPYLEKAFKLSERLTEKDRLSIKAWYEIANLDFPAAIETYSQIIAKYPLETESYWRLGRLLYGEEKSDEAIEILKQGLIIDSSEKNIYNHLGGIYSRLGKHVEAIAAHQRYVALAPNEANAFDSLGLSYQWAGNYIKAMDNYHQALKLNPNFEIAQVHLANTHFQMGQYRTAESLYRRYIEIAPSESEKERGWSCLAVVYLRKRDFASAEKAAQEVLKINREDGWSEFLVAAEKGDLKRANQLEKTILLFSKNNNRGGRTNQRFELFPRGYLALKKGNNEEAVNYFQELIQLRPPTWNIETYEDALANAYLQLGRTDEAIAEYKRILQLNPNYPLAHFHLAQAYQAKGLSNEANDSYRKFLEIWKHADSDIPEIIAAGKALHE